MERISEWLLKWSIPFRENVSGAQMTTFGSGGAVRYAVTPRDEKELIKTLCLCASEGALYRIWGGGSNVLLPDKGYDGVLVEMKALRAVTVQGAHVTVGAGMRLPVFARMCMDRSLSGAEFAEGIPGEIGGAVYMNASAYGSGVSDILHDVRLFYEGRVTTLPASALAMRYHKGGLPKGAVLLSATFHLTGGTRTNIAAVMRSLAEKRADSQPRERSAGSVFSRVGNLPAALYIEKTGLKGDRRGGAELSAKHCNFIVNRGGATTDDYIRLAETVRRKVEVITGVKLDYEVEYIC